MQKLMDKKTWQQPYAMHTWGSAIGFGFTCVLFFVSFGAPAWWVSYYERDDGLVSEVQFGLWRLCVRGYCIYDMTSKHMVGNFMPADILPPYYEGKMIPAQVLMCLNVINIAIVLGLYFAFFIGKATYFMECFFQMLMGIFCIASVTTFAKDFRSNRNYLPFGYAYWFNVAAAVFFIANSLVMFAIAMAVHRRRQERKQMANMTPMA